jgi:glutamate--cysteine ligase catalytic subunit
LLFSSFSRSLIIYFSMKIEYMVVLFDKDEKNAKLSLRQTEILAKLGTIVNNIASGCAEE